MYRQEYTEQDFVIKRVAREGMNSASQESKSGTQESANAAASSSGDDAPLTREAVNGSTRQYIALAQPYLISHHFHHISLPS